MVKQRNLRVPTFTVEKQDDVLAKGLVCAPVGRKYLDHFVRKGNRRLHTGGDHKLFVENELRKNQVAHARWVVETYQKANSRVVVRVVDIVGNLLDDLEQHLDEIIAYMCCNNIS